MKKIIKIGLTGGYGSGKSLISKIFADLGCGVIDADEVAHYVIGKGKPAWKKVISHFGKSILNEDSSIDRKRLARIVFNKKSELEFLNSAVHPAVIREINKRLSIMASRGRVKIAIVSAPLLIEAGMAGMFDKIIVIKIKKEVQLKRCMESKGEPLVAIKKRIAAQLPQSEKLKHADYCVDNNGAPRETEKQVIEILKNINKKTE